MARTCTRSELARLAGVSPAAITKACKRALKAACVGRRIDLDHAAVTAYLIEKGVDPTAAPPSGAEPPKRPTALRPKKPPPAPPREAPATAEPIVGEAVRSIEGLEHLTLQQLVDRFGTLTAFRDWLDARKKLADLREKELRNEEAQGKLIRRDLVRTHVFGALDAGNRRLLRDTPKTLARRVYALALSGTAAEEAEATIREIISDQLRPVKLEAARLLRRGR